MTYQSNPERTIHTKMPNNCSTGGIKYSVKSMVMVVFSNFKKLHKFPLVTLPYTVEIDLLFSALNFCAAIMEAIHCPKPPLRFSFFASMITIAGASINNCSGERLIRKSQKPVKPTVASTLNSSPEKKLISRFRSFRNSNKIGLIINSERAFSEPIAIARGILSSKNSAKYELGKTDSISVRKRLPSTNVRLNFCLTLEILKSL